MAQDTYLPASLITTGGLASKTTDLGGGTTITTSTNLGGEMRKATIPYTELQKTATASAGTNYIIIKKLPASAIVTFSRVKHSTLFAASGLSALVVTPVIVSYTDTAGVPTAALSTALHGGTGLDVFAAAVGTTDGTNLKTDITGAAPALFGSLLTAVALRVIPTNANTSTLSAGQLDVWFDYIVMGL